MDLYFSPLACSHGDAGSRCTKPALTANYLEVDPKTKVVQNDGSDFRDVNPLGPVRPCAPTMGWC